MGEESAALASPGAADDGPDADVATATETGRPINPWIRRALAACIGALLAFAWSRSIADLVAPPDITAVATPGMTFIPYDVQVATSPNPARWIAPVFAAIAAGILGGIDLRPGRRAIVAGAAAVVAAASALWVLHTWVIDAGYPYEFQQLGDDDRSLRWFAAAIAAGTLGAVVVAWVVARWRPGWSGAPVALVGIAWAVVGSGYRRPFTLSTRPFERADGADVFGALDRAPMLLAAGLTIAVIGVAIAVWAPRSSSTPPAVALSSILAAGAVYVVGSSATQVEVIVATFVEGRPARRRGHAVTPTHAVRARMDGTPSGGPGDSWLRAAAAESSSITAFTELAAHLAVMGAPPRLVERCERAAADEIRHVSCCVALAAAEGVIGQPGAVPPAPARPARWRHPRPRRQELRRMVRDSIIDGMLGEGFAAARLEVGASHASDPEARRALAGVARDERSHAALAADIVCWCATVDPALTRHEIARTVRRIDPATVEASDLDRLDDVSRRRAGFVDADQARRCWRDTCHAVVADLDGLSARR